MDDEEDLDFGFQESVIHFECLKQTAFLKISQERFKRVTTLNF